MQISLRRIGTLALTLGVAALAPAALAVSDGAAQDASAVATVATTQGGDISTLAGDNAGEGAGSIVSAAAIGHGEDVRETARLQNGNAEARGTAVSEVASTLGATISAVARETVSGADRSVTLRSAVTAHGADVRAAAKP